VDPACPDPEDLWTDITCMRGVASADYSLSDPREGKVFFERRPGYLVSRLRRLVGIEEARLVTEPSEEENLLLIKKEVLWAQREAWKKREEWF